MATGTTNLRQAETRLTVEGILAEKTLEEVTVDGKTSIRGNLVIQTTPENQITLNVYINKITNAGTENKAYKGIETVMTNYKSIAEVGLDEATRIRVTNGQVEPNTYYDNNGMEHNNVRYKSNFFNSLKAGEELEPKADFEIELYVNSIRPEVNTDGDETGRVFVDGIVPLYSGCEIITLIASNEVVDGVDWAEAITNGYEVGQTGKFYGRVVNERKETIKLIPMLGGATREEKSYTYNSGLLITGASNPYEEENPNNYALEAIKAGMAERELLLAEKKKKAVEKNSSSNATGVTKTSTTSGRTMPKAMF